MRSNIVTSILTVSNRLPIIIDETIKRGDRLTLQTQGTVPQQDERIIYEVIAADTVETQTYSGVGIKFACILQPFQEDE